MVSLVLWTNMNSSLVLAWAPIVDGRPVFAWMLYGVNGFYGFEWRLFFATKVLVVSRMGSQLFKS